MTANTTVRTATAIADPNNPTNAQYVVQPFATPANLVRFEVQLRDTGSDLAHVLRW